ncbi:MAG: bifunctional UDP-N-acetylmuramoyl-tripeptide:D-alanyl-D-alanine ligase/alanine racemase [Bacteroidia bacterium]|nr:bifunctional UDP-N-acetylmuramoyl-tripeptide:D-alanyl-D-alanine ligase/alanine racemase [Bacteroidia bacterium]
MGNYRMDELARYAGGTYYKNVQEEQITELLYDSRRIYRPGQSLFVALKSYRNDGHRYIPGLVRAGIKNFLVSSLPAEEFCANANFILVPDTLQAMQKIAAAHRRHFNIPVLAITGSNGKTIVKEWIYELLHHSMPILRSAKSYNSQLGVPLSVWQLSEEHQFAIFEAGISEPGEMEVLEQIIRPDLGLITNIGSAHLENFDHQETLLEEKLRLFDGVRKVYYCRDFELIHKAISAKGIKAVTWGYADDADYRILSAQLQTNSTTVNISHCGKQFSFEVPFTDKASVENTLHAAVFSLDQGIPAESVIQRVQALHPLEMRLELRKGKHHCTIINDAYSADFDSLKIAIDYTLQQVQHHRRTVILSDFAETGKDKEEFYRKISELLNAKGIERLIGIGNDISLCGQNFKGETMFYHNTGEFLQQLPSVNFNHECILLKGARQFEFEQIFSLLQEKFHETVLEVNLSAMVQNLNYYRSLLPPQVKTMAMVKAFSYGSGSVEVAGVLQANGIDYLAVAYADEGIELRKAGISVPIMVMNPEPESLLELITFDLEPEVYSFRILGLLHEVVKGRNSSGTQPVKVHLKLDTGMHRLGFGENDVRGLAEFFVLNTELEIASVFSHLAASEEPQQDDFTQLQIARFEQMTSTIAQITKKKFLKHILNSAGISRHQKGVFDMVRLGIGLYGVGNAKEQDKLIHVSSLRTTISQIHELEPGETVGYGRIGRIEKKARIATIAIGYADGFPRKLGYGKGQVIIKGKKAATIGSICMDMCMVDITEIQDAQEGDPVIVFETPGQLYDLAQQLETIPYEVLTSISARVKRVYFQE